MDKKSNQTNLGLFSSVKNEINGEILFQFQLEKQFHFGFTLFGILGNFICIMVLKKRSLLKQKFNWYLLFQALTDLIFLGIIFVTSILKFFFDPRIELQDFSFLFCYLTDYIYESLNSLGVLLTLVLSVDRLYAILRPMKIKSFVTYRFPIRITLATYLVVLLLKSPELYLNQPKYHSNSSYGERCTWSISPKDFSKKMFYIIDSRVIIPTCLVIVPALISFILNVVLWFYMCHYIGKPVLPTTSQKSVPTCHVHTKACSPSNCEIARNLKSVKTPYHLTIIMLNIIDLPYYCFHMYFIFEAIFKWKNFKYETTNPVTKKISRIFFFFFILGHSINIVVYMIFHKEFRSNVLRIFRRFNCICNKRGNNSSSIETSSKRTKSSNSQFLASERKEAQQMGNNLLETDEPQND